MSNTVDKIAKILSRSFLTANSDGYGTSHVEIKTESLTETHELHRLLILVARRAEAKED